jgi:O-antigen/teichoic acid export membrane protein
VSSVSTIDAPPPAADAPSPRIGQGLGRSGAWSAANRILGAAGSLVVLRLGTQELPSAELGIWLLLWACVPLFGFLDLGISNAIVSRVATSRAAERDAEARATLSSALLVLVLVGLATATVGTAVVALVPSFGLLGIADRQDGLVRTGATILCLVAAAGLPLGLAQRALHGCQRVASAARVAALGNVLQVVFAGIAATAGAGFPWWVAVVLSPMLVTGLLSWLVLARGELRTLRPAARYATATEARGLARTGVLFAGLALAGTVAFETDALVISAVLGPDDVARFAIPARILLMIPAILQMAFLPLWPAIASSIATGDRIWARQAFRRALRWCTWVSPLIAAASCLAIGPAMRFVAPGVARPSAGLLAALAAVAVVHSVSVPYAAALSGIGALRPQLLASAAMAVCNIALSVLLVHAVGVAGPPLATVTTQVLLVLVPLTPVIERAWRTPPVSSVVR